jgi:hypothetical protein
VATTAATTTPAEAVTLVLYFQADFYNLVGTEDSYAGFSDALRRAMVEQAKIPLGDILRIELWPGSVQAEITFASAASKVRLGMSAVPGTAVAAAWLLARLGRWKKG